MDLSIIIPAYNVESYIAACLRSVSTWPLDNIDMECIVVNDGSSDETENIVKRYMQRDNRIKLVNKENGGVSEARNTGINIASGRYIMFLDADDKLCEDAWEHVEAAIKEEYADFTAFSYITYWENGKMKADMLPIDDVVSTDKEVAVRLMYADSVFNMCWGKLFRSDIIKDNKVAFRTDLPIGEDYLFVADYFKYCQSFYMTKAMIVYYLQRSTSAMRSYSFEQRLGFTKILYDYNVKAVGILNDSQLMSMMDVYYLKVLTNLFYEYAKAYGKDYKTIDDIYDSALHNSTVIAIIDKVKIDHIGSILKRYEYKLLKGKNVKKIRKYFCLKAKL